MATETRGPTVVVGGFSHELHSFTDPTGVTTLADMEIQMPTVRGSDLFASIIGEGIELNGIADTAAAEGITLLGTVYAGGTVGPRVDDAVYAMVRDGILEGIRAAGPDLAGVMLPIHGANATQSLDDVEGQLLAEVRAAVGPDVPIAAAFDLHGHGTEVMAASADVLVAFRTCPHTDYYDTGARTMRLLARTIRGEIRPVTAFRKLRLMTTAEKHDSNHGPMRDFQAAARALEERPGILAVSVFATQPWMDVPELGWSVMVVADGDRGAAQRAADDLAWTIWDRRQDLLHTKTPVDAAIRIAVDSPGIPVVFADGADTTTGGGFGDGNLLLRALLEAGYEDTAHLAIADPAAVETCMQAGIGATVTLPVGGTMTPRFFTPLEVTGRVVTLADGHYTSELPVRKRNVGRIAVLEVGGISVVLTEIKAAQLDPSIYRRAGLEPRRARIVQAKSAGGFRAAFEPIAAQIVDVDLPGPCDHELTRLPFRAIPRPMWPWDRDLASPWEGATRVSAP